MLSVIVPLGGKKSSQEVENEIKKALSGVEGEVIFAANWGEGLSLSNGDYVAFLTPSFDLSEGHFRPLYDYFRDNPSFRKLAIVAPVSGSAASSQAYPVQVTSLVGAVIRKSALKEITVPLTNNPALDSANICIDFWNRGLRVYTYPGVENQNSWAHVKEPEIEPDEKVVKLWKREMIT